MKKNKPGDHILFGVFTYLSEGSNALMMKKGIRKNNPNSGNYAPSGGNLEDHERGLNPAGRLEAAIRETREETGLTVLDPVWRGIILFHNFEREFPNWPNPEDFLVYVFSATKYSGKLGKGKKKEIPLWIPEKEIPYLPQNPGDRKIYEWLKDGRFFAGIIKHKGKEIDDFGTHVDFLTYPPTN